MNKPISFERLLEIDQGSEMTKEESSELKTFNTVYIIYNTILNKAYIGETTDTYIRLFKFWKKDKRHVSGENSPIMKYFKKDYKNTFFMILEEGCNNQEKEFYWNNYYRENSSFVIISHPGRHGCNNPGNKGLMAVHKDSSQTYINSIDLDFYKLNGWEIGGKKQSPRSDDQKRNISNAHKGLTPWNKGIKLTEDQKMAYRKPKNIKIKREYSSDQIKILREKNIGRVKIHKDSIELQVPKEELESYLADGWIKGIRQKLAKYQKPSGEIIIYNKSSAARNHKDWIFLEDLP